MQSIEARLSCLHGKHITSWTIALAPFFLCLDLFWSCHSPENKNIISFCKSFDILCVFTMIDFEERIFVFSFLLIPNAVAQISFKCGVNMLKAKDFENLWYFPYYVVCSFQDLLCDKSVMHCVFFKSHITLRKYFYIVVNHFLLSTHVKMCEEFIKNLSLRIFLPKIIAFGFVFKIFVIYPFVSTSDVMYGGPLGI